MTLIVTLRTPDGVVIAGDSLSTLTANKLIEGDFNLECPHCHEAHTFKGRMPNIYHSNTLSHAQKVFPFMRKFGVGTFGMGQVAGKTIYFALRELETNLSQDKNEVKILKTILEVANAIGKHVQNLILEQIRHETKDKAASLQPNVYPIGFQIVGYDDMQKPLTIEMHVGNDIKIVTHNELGITYTGQPEVVNALFARFKTNPEEMPIFQNFSLQDAITYAEFLIKTTSTYQRFSSNMATVGGNIDVALVTPFDGFKWIKQKSLQAKLLGEMHA